MWRLLRIKCIQTTIRSPMKNASHFSTRTVSHRYTWTHVQAHTSTRVHSWMCEADSARQQEFNLCRMTQFFHRGEEQRRNRTYILCLQAIHRSYASPFVGITCVNFLPKAIQVYGAHIVNIFVSMRWIARQWMRYGCRTDAPDDKVVETALRLCSNPDVRHPSTRGTISRC